MQFSSSVFIFFVAVLALGVQAQQTKSASAKPKPAKLNTPEVHSDNTVTFRFDAPNAHEVKLDRDGAGPVAMQKDDEGIWSVTTPPLAPDYYEYSTLVDGVRMLDPNNSLLVPNLITPANAVYIRGDGSQPWDMRDVPHGEIHHHFYASAVAGDNRDYYVYTPPNYDPETKKAYPILYLLHGFSDDASGWTAVGHANLILDNLIAQGKAKPMIVVMPLGYGTMEVIRRGWGALDHEHLRDENFLKFRQMLLSEVMPRVESEYHIAQDPRSRAIAGLSMGGAESLFTGLNNLDKFGWIGSFSAGHLSEPLDKDFPGLDARSNQQLFLLWIACGTEDELIRNNRNIREWLKAKGINHVPIETPGQHTWMVWRRNLVEFAPLLFQHAMGGSGSD